MSTQGRNRGLVSLILKEGLRPSPAFPLLVQVIPGTFLSDGGAEKVAPGLRSWKEPEIFQDLQSPATWSCW